MKAPRHGYTLVECLVVFGLVSVTLSSVGITLHGLRRAEIRLRREWDDERQWEQFVQRWREDAHASKSARTSMADTEQVPRRLELHRSDERTIEYLLAEDRIERVVRETGEIQHRESYAVKLHPTAHWEIDSDGQHPLVTLQLGANATDRVDRWMTAVNRYSLTDSTQARRASCGVAIFAINSSLSPPICRAKASRRKEFGRQIDGERG